MSLIRFCLSPYSLTEEDRPKVAEVWPILLTEKYPVCEDVFMDVDELPDWVGEVHAVTLKPLKRVKFVKPSPNFGKGNIPEVREFVKTVNQIVMPGFELLRYGAIEYHIDACTEAIQHELDKGWRIIAVLPQAGQRRPDYIMVRENK